ncbi:MAG: ferrous iron transport protein A [Clostridia bacterium]|nr:ferrous iron transport protein A [Clostridia bacterium]
MTLKNCPKNKICKIISLNIIDDKLKLRLYEIGFFVGSYIQVLNISALKKTMLIQVLDSCFAIKSSIADCIEVEYV